MFWFQKQLGVEMEHPINKKTPPTAFVYWLSHPHVAKAVFDWLNGFIRCLCLLRLVHDIVEAALEESPESFQAPDLRPAEMFLLPRIALKCTWYIGVLLPGFSGDLCFFLKCFFRVS